MQLYRFAKNMLVSGKQTPAMKNGTAEENFRILKGASVYF